VTLSAYEADGGRLVAHLVNYAAGESPKGLSLELGNRRKNCRTARMLVSDGPERSLVIGRATRPSVEIPPFAGYGVVIVE